MTDIRERLNARREQLKAEIHKAEEWVDRGANPTSEAWAKSSRDIQEILQIEAILAQMQTADAQRDLADAQRSVAKAQSEATTESEQLRSSNEGSAFWSRRFFTSVAVGNGAGAFATISALLRPDPPLVSHSLAIWILACFLAGVALAGLLPLALVVQPKIDFRISPWPIMQRIVVGATFVAAILFIAGAAPVALVAFDTLDQHIKQAKTDAASLTPAGASAMAGLRRGR